jgi:hypothetical protein
MVNLQLPESRDYRAGFFFSSGGVGFHPLPAMAETDRGREGSTWGGKEGIRAVQVRFLA